MVMAEEIVVLDEGHLLELIQSLPTQLEEAWTSLKVNPINLKTDQINHILLLGMGGSGIAGRLLKEFAAECPIPIDIWADYGVPAWVNDKTLVIGVSYSGNTEETLDGLKHALERKAQIIGIASGGKLPELAKANNFPVIVFGDKPMPPRASLGYQYGLLLALMAKFGFIDLKEDTYRQALTELKTVVDQKTFLPKAQELAISLNNKVPIILSHWPLTSVGYRWQSQMHENAKSFAYSGSVPEVCHNLILGFDFPIPEKMVVLYLESSFGFSRNIAREKILQKLLTAKGVTFTPLSVKSGSILAEQWLLLYFGDLLSYYLAGIYGVDPTPFEMIEKLKQELEKA